MVNQDYLPVLQAFVELLKTPCTDEALQQEINDNFETLLALLFSEDPDPATWIQAIQSMKPEVVPHAVTFFPPQPDALQLKIQDVLTAVEKASIKPTMT